MQFIAIRLPTQQPWRSQFGAVSQAKDLRGKGKLEGMVGAILSEAWKCHQNKFQSGEQQGKYAQHALQRNEKRNTLSTAIEEFAEKPISATLQYIRIAKTFTEMSVLRSAFSKAVILLCQLHVIKYLQGEIVDGHYAFNPWQKEQLRGLMVLLVYSKSERGYEKYLPYVWHVIKVRGSLTAQRESQQQVMCPVEQAVYSVGQQSDPAGQESGLVGQDFPVGQERDASTKNPFELYFLRSWGNCRQLWCSYKRPNAVTLRKNTNNRLNASCKQIKDVVNSTMELDESVTSLMYCQSHAEKLLMDQVYKVSVVHLAKFIREIQYVPNLVSEHAWDLIYEQFIFAAGRISFKFYELMPGVYFIKCTVNVDDAMDEPNEEYFVTKKCCKCLFMSK